MEAGDKQRPKNTLPEALDPEIGNSSFWELNPHFRSLRMVDPIKDLENGMISDEERNRIIDLWSGQPVQPVEEGTVAATAPETDENPVRHKLKGKKKLKKIHSVTKSKETEADWMEEPVPSTGTDSPVEITRGDPEEQEIVPKDEPVIQEKPGKRVRKVVRVAEEEQMKAATPLVSNTPPSMESTLSPFTRWLKGLRGSEYVHPYEDDFALDQRAGNNRDGISETFADLLAAQGYRDQAIDMYRLLMAKYPEKSSFFAAKIEAL